MTRDGLGPEAVPPRRLLELVDAARLPAALHDIMIHDVCDDSRRVQRGAAFVAVAGNAADGRQYIAEARARGAAVIIGADLPDTGATPRWEVETPRRVLAELAAAFYGVDPRSAPRLTLVGVTGTNGKSTTAYMVRAILHAAGRRCGMLGTIEYDLVGRKTDAALTTPGAVELAARLAEARAHGADSLVMECSSHALDQDRVAGLQFDAAVFTNLSGDHLDYHKTMEDYAAAKARLFQHLTPDATAIVNADDRWTAQMLEGCRGRVLRFSLHGKGDVSAKILKQSVEGTRFRLHLGAEDVVMETAMVGRHNVCNALAAAAAAHALGVGVDALVAGLQGLKSVPGRLQRVACDAPGQVFVDYAHTDDALDNVLRVLRPLTHHRLVVVFGCGGDRDRSKRPRMAAAAARHADAILVTSDNPRSEDPRAIISEIVAGFSAEDRKRVMIEPDRRSAIGCAMATLGPGDVLLVAGKGHETYQILGAQRVHFDDAEEVQNAASLRPSKAG